jgi:nicotinamidase-related amidase
VRTAVQAAATGALVALAVSLPTAGAVAQVQMPTLPQPVAVTVDAKTTAYLVLDLTSVICAPLPACRATLPAAAALLTKARNAGALVVYSQTPTPGSMVLPEVAPRPGEPTVATRADKFFGTVLDDTLKSKGIKTVVIVGSAANGAVLYTAFGANERGYTVVVAVDGISAADPFAVFATQYQLLHQPGFDNRDNKPLVDDRVTLSRTDLITFH